MLDELGEVTALARGLPPRWVTDIPGCEACAVLQAAMVSEPGRVSFKSDCQPCVRACKSSLKNETTAKRKHARIYNQLLPLLDGASDETMTWMRAHTSAIDVGSKRCGDGRLLTAIDMTGQTRTPRSQLRNTLCLKPFVSAP